jgi:hypothetical protein
MAIMDKYSRLATMVKDKITPDFIANEIVTIVTELMNGKHGRNEELSLFWTVGVVLDVSGFYVNYDIVQELIASYMGRLLRMAAKQYGINLNITAKSSVRKMTGILNSTNTAETAAIPIAIERMKTKFGIPTHIDSDKAQELISIRDAAVYRAMNP